MKGDVENGVFKLFEPSLEDRSKFFFHPLGSVPNGDSDCRIIVDTSATSLNDAILDSKIQLPNIRPILNRLK